MRGVKRDCSRCESDASEKFTRLINVEFTMASVVVRYIIRRYFPTLYKCIYKYERCQRESKSQGSFEVTVSPAKLSLPRDTFNINILYLNINYVLVI